VSAPSPERAGRVVAAIALGSNVGDRSAHLERAVREIASIAGVTLVGVSRWIETEAEGDAVGQPPFLNGAVVVETRLSPRELLEELQSIELAHARERSPGVRHAPRTLDLDLIVHGEAVVDEPGLTLPHPCARERRFVLAPLAEIAPDIVFPRDPRGPAAKAGELLRALDPHSSRSSGRIGS
jgi:2-amino-4-hydroxy-6-hydroxymethyldihydropteridine diphosphokinase